MARYLWVVVSVIFLTTISPSGAIHGQEIVSTEVPPEYIDLVPQEIRDHIELLSGSAMLNAAKALGVTTVAGKDISTGGSPPGNANAKKLKDVGFAAHPTKHENEPTVAANPMNKKNLVAGSHFFGPPAPTGNRCLAFSSFDRGATWSAGVMMPQLTPLSSCSDPVLAFAPDGSRVYYAYMDIKFIFTSPPPTLTIDFDILVSFSNDGGVTWTGPIVALNGAPTIIVFFPFSITLGFEYDKPWVGTHVDDSQSNWVYVTATRFDESAPFACHIAFARSSNQGVTWSSATILESGGAPCGARVVQGSRPSGGVGGDVLVAWYDSAFDGWLSGSFRIRTRYSANNGATWGMVETAATETFEAPFFLGPNLCYERWWAVMFPDVEIDPGGEAHVAYTRDPVPQVGFSIVNPSAEDGDIRYISSPASPYAAGSWSAPVTVNDDGLVRAQGYAALETQHGGQSSSLHVTWMDYRLSPTLPTPAPDPTFVSCETPGTSNQRFDIFYSRKTGSGWMKNFRVSDASSESDFIFLGDYIDIGVNETTRFTAWTDRRHQTTIFAFEDNSFGSGIISGGAAP